MDRNSLNSLANEIWDTCEEKGWNEDLVLGNAIANMHTEISEAWEHIREGHRPNETWVDMDYEGGKPDGFPIELADVIIRVLHTMKYYGIDPEDVMRQKMDYNKTRPYRHGGKAC